MNKIYAGIGSRKTPRDTLLLMTTIAQKLGLDGYLLRSGGAEGADKAFQAGAERMEIFRPHHATTSHIEIASQYHPAWNHCSEYVRKLHGRNVMIILGEDLKKPAQFVIYWTPDLAGETGGTGLGVRVARAHKIPVFNLARTHDANRIRKWLIKER